jgi:hypothetical protein
VIVLDLAAAIVIGWLLGGVLRSLAGRRPM